MARIRTIKPELLEDAKTARLAHLAWRLFVSLILLADDYGNLRGDPERIHGVALWAHPREDSREPREDFRTALGALLAAELVIAYEVRGQSYLHIAGWEKHQKVDHPGKPLCPGFGEGSRVARESVATVPERLAPDQDQDQDHDQDHDREPCAPARSTRGAKLWNAHDWRAQFGRAWAEKYQRPAYGDAGDTKASVTLGDLLDGLPESERLEAQAKAPGMFAEFLASIDALVVRRRHPFCFFVQEWGGLRVPKKAAPADARCAYHRAYGTRGKLPPRGAVDGCPECKHAGAAAGNRSGDPAPVSDLVAATDRKLAEQRRGANKTATREELDQLKAEMQQQPETAVAQ